MATLREVREGEREARAELFRARRIFVGLSLLLSAVHGLGIKLKSDVALSGVNVEIADPHLLVSCLWIGWIWSLLRYFQYHSAFTDSYAREVRTETHKQAAFEIARRKAEREALKGAYKQGGIPEGPIRVYASGRGLEHTKDGGAFFKEIMVQKLDSSTRQVDGQAVPITVALTANELRQARRDAEFAFHTRQPFTLDYFAPYVFAILLFAGLVLAWIRH